ncbi:hypothetical protein [Paenibacillus planticolens]|uniref:Uncharacterized protein n=1 Tax=Paenibacillus planticolens TaxID=2654976 RepID=A0ABX1ZRW8_9BACL|nr:hypothetical protein [Paenibacillus planticolens]NOV01365.1 hypothetical protein [Paenibacillus planticolens]
MPNINQEELRSKLFPNEVKEYLEEHPSLYGRAAKMYLAESLTCAKKKAAYELEKSVESANAVIAMLTGEGTESSV